MGYEPYGNGHIPFGTIYRLREGIERFMITDINNPAGSAKAQSDIPVMWDNTMMDYGDAVSFSHYPSGANGRQCITQRIYPSREDSQGIILFSRGGDIEIPVFDAWKMHPSNPW